MKGTKTISIIIITWNSEKKIRTALNYIRKQDFLKEKLELIVVDGGSKDKTLKIIQNEKKRMNIQLIKTKIKDQEPKRAIGVLKAKGKYVCFIDPDNYMTEGNWLSRMVRPLEEDRSISGVQTLFYTYDKFETPINRYFALFGINDPVVFYLGKADRIPYFENKWLNDKFEDKGDYYKIELKDNNVPTMGCNGVILRRSHYLKANIKPDNFFHIDVIQDLVKKNYRFFAIVKNGILHSTGSTFFSSIGKRIEYMNIHYYKRQNQRRYFVFDSKSTKDKINLFKFTFFTLTFIEPLFLSIRGYIKKRDWAWFLHWPMCFGFLIAYSDTVIKESIKKFFEKSKDAMKL